MSDSVQPHGLQPTRLLHPWDSPGKSTGVGCHYVLQCMKVESESEVAQSCLTLSDPMDCSLPGSSIHGIFRATVLEWGAIACSLPGQAYIFIHKPLTLDRFLTANRMMLFLKKIFICLCWVLVVHAGSLVVAHGLSCSMPCRILVP